MHARGSGIDARHLHFFQLFMHSLLILVHVFLFLHLFIIALCLFSNIYKSLRFLFSFFLSFFFLSFFFSLCYYYLHFTVSSSFYSYLVYGGVAQMVEHSLCMRGAAGSMPATSTFFLVSSLLRTLSLLFFLVRISLLLNRI